MHGHLNVKVEMTKIFKKQYNACRSSFHLQTNKQL